MIAQRKLNFLLISIYHTLAACRYRTKAALSAGEGLALIHNWVDSRSITESGEYRDNYFGGLAQHLIKKGKKVFIVPRLSFTVPYRRTLKQLKSIIKNMIPVESYLTMPDICRVFLSTLYYVPCQRHFPTFEGMDITGIIMHDRWQDWALDNRTSNLFFYEAVKRWKKAGLRVAEFIYPYENQVWEKSYCLAFRKYYPSTKLIGYQHSTVPKMLLSHFFAKEELPLLPFPDKVITAGKYTEKLFKTSGYDPTKVIRGGAIRYAGLLKKKDVAAKRDTTIPTILVAPSVDKNETIELTWKVIQTFKNTKQYRIIIKFHPDCPYRIVAGDIGTVPGHFVISEKPADSLLQESNVLLYTSSGTSIEALILGVPILHVKSDFTIDRDNLADFPGDVRESVSNPDDIAVAVARLIKMDKKELSRKRQLWKIVVAEMFGPVDEGTYDLFL